jgi:hypothetical protein
MIPFTNIKDLISNVQRNKLTSVMFSKQKAFDYKCYQAPY